MEVNDIIKRLGEDLPGINLSINIDKEYPILNESKMGAETKESIQMGRKLYNQQKYEEAIKILKGIPQASDYAEVNLLLGCCNYSLEEKKELNKTNEIEPLESVLYFMKAAEQGNEDAIVNLRILATRIHKESTICLNCIFQLASNNNPHALRELGIYNYFLYLLDPENFKGFYDYSYQYWEKAANNGDKFSSRRLKEREKCI